MITCDMEGTAKRNVVALYGAPLCSPCSSMQVCVGGSGASRPDEHTPRARANYQRDWGPLFPNWGPLLSTLNMSLTARCTA
eukprot:1743746-Prymnesium_polylepis.1